MLAADVMSYACCSEHASAAHIGKRHLVRPVYQTMNADAACVVGRQFPRVGAYWACALKGSGDRVEAILAADSLMPPGHGRPLSDQDR